MEELLRFRWVNPKEDYRPPASIILFRIVHKLGSRVDRKMYEYLKLETIENLFFKLYAAFMKRNKADANKNRLEAKKQ